MAIKGKVYRTGNDIDTDVIIPARHLMTTDETELAKHAMEDYDKDFSKKPHDIIVAGTNFGQGSSREHAPICLKASGVKCIVAKSFARIFFRNCINLGLPAVACDEANKIGDEAEVDIGKGEIRSNGKTFKFRPYSKEVQEILAAGGLVAMIKKKLKNVS
jgi:3-isopropylmalate/(R)-2-methylmalate dehydratase small subunit